ncbi:hypothetical protein LguiB_011861 [Lonicera macranthoides]
MARTCSISSYYIVSFFISHFKSLIGKLIPWTNSLPYEILSLDLSTRLHFDHDAISKASTDFGKILQKYPSAVLYPSSINDLINLIRFSYNCSVPFGIAARGHGHSVRGQAMAHNGVVVDMSSLKNGIRVSWCNGLGFYADVGGEQLWIDVLNAALDHGLSPVSWTDYLYLTVGGTLSNAGISGQSFRCGPQISNVHELDVITGKGEFVTCSKRMNSELFYAVLGGLGQFGIITRARIVLDKAPTRTDQSKINSLLDKHDIIYCLEAVKYYDDLTVDSVDAELQVLLQGLNYITGFEFKKDVLYLDFLNRVRTGELKLQSKGLWDVPHPWLNLFVPKSRIMDFNAGVFVDIIRRKNLTTGPVLVYPMTRKT